MPSGQDITSRARRIVGSGKLPSRLGPYHVESEIGAGAMGIVYRARDPRLDRTVALKALPPAFAEDPERLARFEREARMLAALHHPHVASLHGLEEHEGRRYLVMEFVEGETLGERIARGALDLQEALELAEQIALGLAAAHDAGIIHRDLKPGNVLVTPDGRAKVVDFGLAKDVAPREGGSTALPISSMSGRGSIADEATKLAVEPADTDGALADPIATEPGAVLGTAAYMSPEQARGRALDRRTDVWSFGCVLFEMLTRERPFRGDSLMQTIVAVLQNEPDWALLPADVPQPVRRLLERCLRKDRRERLRDLGDAALDLRELRSGSFSASRWPAAASLPQRSPGKLRTGPAVALLAATLLAVWAWWRAPHPVVERQARLEVKLPHPLYLADQRSVRLSPDGSVLAWNGIERQTGATKIFLRPLDSFVSSTLEGTDNANGFYFSPDGEWIGFLEPRQQQALRVPTSRGTGVRVVAEGIESGSKGATWLADGTIVVGLGFDGALAAFRAEPPNGAVNQVEWVTELGPEVKTHRFPEPLPGGRRVVFTASDVDVDSFEHARLELLDLDSGDTKVLLEGGSDATYVAAGDVDVPGHPEAEGWLVFTRGDALMSVPFDADAGEILGDPAVWVRGVLISRLSGFGNYDVAGDVLVYVEGSEHFEAQRLVRVGRDGSRRTLDVPERAYRGIRVSNDGKWAVLHIDSATGDLWVLDIERVVISRLTSKWDNLMAVWTPDGRVTYCSNRGGRGPAIYLQDADGSAQPELLRDGEVFNVDTWSPDGRWLVVNLARPGSGFDLFALPADGGEMRELVASPAMEYGAAISSGGWLAYSSNETGTMEVYVRPLEAAGPRIQVSSGGGTDPAFSKAGDEIFYRRGRDILGVAFDATVPSVGQAKVVFRDIHLPTGGPPGRLWDLLPDGSLLFSEPLFDPLGVDTVRVVLGIRDELAAAAGGD